MNKTMFLLQKGATVFGIYTSESLAIEAQGEWYNEFMQRFGRAPRLTEMPVVHEMLINGIPAKSQVVMKGAN